MPKLYRKKQKVRIGNTWITENEARYLLDYVPIRIARKVEKSLIRKGILALDKNELKFTRKGAAILKVLNRKGMSELSRG
jgi:predicted methyltransferase